MDKMKLGHRKIIRDGNHFIRFEGGADWVLIDGPWFSILEQYAQHHRVEIPVIEPQLTYVLDPNKQEPPPFVDFRRVTWERVKWTNASGIIVNHFRNNPWKPVPKGYRHHRGWRITPDGHLPLNWYDDTGKEAEERNPYC